MSQQNTDFEHKIFGIFELSDEGTVLSSLVRKDNRITKPLSKMVGKDFFEDIADFENTIDLRRHFRNFLNSRRSFDSFDFHCQYQQQTLRTRICMTRGSESDFANSNGIVILDIRNALL